MPDSLRIIALVLGLSLLGASASAVSPQVARPRTSGTERDSAGWELRRLAAQLLWTKTHAVMHAGVEEREARPGELATRANEVHRHDSSGGPSGEDGHEEEGHEEHGSEPAAGQSAERADDHAGETPEEHAAHAGHGEEQGAYVLVIPPAKEDFRGYLGDLERAVKPYLHEDGKTPGERPDQTLPFFRLMTWSDPHFIQGYTVGANFLADVGRDVDQGLEFLREGERANPDSFEIQTELGHLLLVYKSDYAGAERHLRRALELVPRDRKLAELEQDALTDAYRWLALTYREWGKPEQAVAVAREGTRILGEDPSLHRILDTSGRR